MRTLSKLFRQIFGSGKIVGRNPQATFVGGNAHTVAVNQCSGLGRLRRKTARPLCHNCPALCAAIGGSTVMIAASTEPLHPARSQWRVTIRPRAPESPE